MMLKIDEKKLNLASFLKVVNPLTRVLGYKQIIISLERSILLTH
jgi:hypothetical protein